MGVVADGEEEGGIKTLYESSSLERRVGGGGLVEGEYWWERFERERIGECWWECFERERIGESWLESFEWEGIIGESVPVDERECWCAGADEEPVKAESDCMIVDGEGEGDIKASNDSSSWDLERWEEGREILVEHECWECWKESLEQEGIIGEPVPADEEPSVDE